MLRGQPGECQNGRWARADSTWPGVQAVVRTTPSCLVLGSDSLGSPRARGDPLEFWLCFTSLHTETTPRSFGGWRGSCEMDTYYLAHKHVTSQHAPLCWWLQFPGWRQASGAGPALSPGPRLTVLPLGELPFPGGVDPHVACPPSSFPGLENT